MNTLLPEIELEGLSRDNIFEVQTGPETTKCSDLIGKARQETSKKRRRQGGRGGRRWS